FATRKSCLGAAGALAGCGRLQPAMRKMPKKKKRRIFLIVGVIFRIVHDLSLSLRTPIRRTYTLIHSGLSQRLLHQSDDVAIMERRREAMPCDIDVLKKVPLFGLLDDEELAVLAAQTDLRNFTPRQRIYKMGEMARGAYVVISGAVRVTTI